MDMFPTDSIQIIVAVFKVIFLIIGLCVLAITYFHTKESRKMEKRLMVSLPGSMQVILSLQYVFSLMFVVLMVIFLFLP